MSYSFKFKIGDIVDVRGTVVEQRAGLHSHVTVRFDGGSANDWYLVAPTAVTLIRRVFVVGDRVYHPRGVASATILAIDGERLWLKSDDGIYAMGSLTEIRLVPQETDTHEDQSS